MGTSLSKKEKSNFKGSHYCKVDFEINPDCWMFVNGWDRDWCLDLIKRHSNLGWRKLPVLSALTDDFPKENVQFAIIQHHGRQILAIENVCPRYKDYCIVYDVL